MTHGDMVTCGRAFCFRCSDFEKNENDVMTTSRKNTNKMRRAQGHSAIEIFSIQKPRVNGHFCGVSQTSARC